jgi:hypothetical protein
VALVVWVLTVAYFDSIGKCGGGVEGCGTWEFGCGV